MTQLQVRAIEKARRELQRAKNELNLTTRHVWFQLLDHIGCDNVALLYENLIDTRKANSRAS